jgi:hypothetical protein
MVGQGVFDWYWLDWFSIGSDKKYGVKISPVVGEILQAGSISEAGFKTLQGISIVLSKIVF